MNCNPPREHVDERITFEDENETYWTCDACGAEWGEVKGQHVES